MADYYQEARRAKRDLKQVADENKKRREDRRDKGLEDDHVEHPLNYLTIEGRGIKLHRNAEQHAALERQDGLIPWNGDPENLIDRFDARALLDFYRDPPPGVHQRPKTAQEEKLQEQLVFESYRDLVRLMARGLSEDKGLKAAHEENLEIRAQRKGAAAAAFRVQSHQSLPGDAAAAAGMGTYSAVGFQYSTGAAAANESSSSSDDEDEGEEEEEEDGAGASNAEEAAAEAEQDRVDGIADQFGLRDFTYRLHRAQQAEGDQDEAWRWKPRKRTGRKAARARARRMAGQGLDPKGAPLLKDWRDPVAMHAPSAHLVRPRRPSPERHGSRSRSRSRSQSPGRRQGSLLGALPSVRAITIDRKAFETKEEDILDALPGAPDPALQGAQHFPAEDALRNIKKQQEAQQRHRSRSRSRGRYRSRSRSRERRSWRTSNDLRRYGSRHSRSRSRDRYRSRSHSRDRHDRALHDRRHDRDRSRGGGMSRSSSDAGGAGPSRQPSVVTTGGGGSSGPHGGGGGGGKETPQERLKRIMAAQLSKQLSKDSAVATQRRIQAEKEKAARTQMQRLVHRSPNRGRSRSRSRSRSPPSGYDRDYERYQRSSREAY